MLPEENMGRGGMPGVDEGVDGVEGDEEPKISSSDGFDGDEEDCDEFDVDEDGAFISSRL